MTSENPSRGGFLSNPSHPGVRTMASEESNMVTIAAEDRRPGSTGEDDEKVRLIANLTSQLQRLEEESRLAENSFFEERASWIQQLSKFEAMLRRTIQSSLSVKEKSDILLRDTCSEKNVGISRRDTSSPVVPIEGNSHLNLPQQTVLSVPVSKTGVDNISLQVEHIVRGACEHKIQPFSGSSVKKGEVDFDEWSKQIELMIEDDSLSVTAKRQLLITSLHSPALDLARGMGQIPAEDILKQFTEMYASTRCGTSLLREFFDMSLNDGESLTDYLQRLRVKMNKVIEKGSLNSSQVDKTITLHFRGTCEDEYVKSYLLVKYGDEFPSIQELMKVVRSIEEMNSDREVVTEEHVIQTNSVIVYDSVVEALFYAGG